jgi:xanthosine utilization system XapX-like protein
MTDDMALGLAGFAVLFLMILLQVPVGVAMALVGVVGTGILIGFEPALGVTRHRALGCSGVGESGDHRHVPVNGQPRPRGGLVG